MQQLSQKVYRWLASDRYFKFLVGFLVVSATWIALTGRYPMAFDEDFHLGLIRVYASHGLPFWSGQPANADAFGAVARDPSYLYHYVFSFIYQIICLFTQNQTIQVIVLRVINIGLFASSLPIFKRLLQRAGGSSALVNATLTLLVLIPITTQLAAQINYDNLIMPITALILLLALTIKQRPVAERPKVFMKIMALGLAGSLIKFAFLPIFIAVLLWLIVQSRPVWRERLNWWHRSMKVTKTKTGILLLLVILVLGVLSVERYGLNLVRYHDPIPDCGTVLTLDNCQYYGPYIRDHNFAANKTNFDTSPLTYTKEWLYGMWLRSFFAIDGPATRFETRGPLVVPAVTALILMAVGLMSVFWSGRKIWRQQPSAVSLFGTVTAIYVTALWLQEYKAYVHTGFPVAINGRYLLLIITLVIFVAATACSRTLGSARQLKTGLIILSIGALLLGGGPLTYILRSSDYWYWPNSSTKSANHAVKHIFGPITPGFNNPTQFLR